MWWWLHKAIDIPAWALCCQIGRSDLATRPRPHKVSLLVCVRKAERCRLGGDIQLSQFHYNIYFVIYFLIICFLITNKCFILNVTLYTHCIIIMMNMLHLHHAIELFFISNRHFGWHCELTVLKVHCTAPLAWQHVETSSFRPCPEHWLYIEINQWGLLKDLEDSFFNDVKKKQ